MSDNSQAIRELLASRMREAEQNFLNSPFVKRWKAKNEHILFEHGTGELCTCPEWQDGPPHS